ncbi:MAG: hypothetical protein ACK55Z_04990, partial [bacterium]
AALHGHDGRGRRCAAGGILPETYTQGQTCKLFRLPRVGSDTPTAVASNVRLPPALCQQRGHRRET